MVLITSYKYTYRCLLNQLLTGPHIAVPEMHVFRDFNGKIYIHQLELRS